MGGIISKGNKAPKPLRVAEKDAEHELTDELVHFLKEEANRSPTCDDIDDIEQGKQEIARYRAYFKQLTEKIDMNAAAGNQDVLAGLQGFRENRGMSSFRNRSTKFSKSERIDNDEEGNEVQVNQYHLGKLLGVGSFGVVVQGTDVDTERQYAIKILDRKKLKRKNFGRPAVGGDTMWREIAIQKKLVHRNILRLIEVIDSEDHPRTYLVMELIDGGPLMQDVVKCDPISEVRARFLFVQIVEALDYLHKLNVIHKDIKPSNVLVEKRTDRIFLSDFGVAQTFKDDELPLIRHTEGTMAFFSPEMCTGEAFNGKSADVWALGATLYMVVTGQPPFLSKSTHLLIQSITNGDISYDNKFKLSSSLIDLLKSILCKDVEKRASLADIAKHRWCDGDEKANLADVEPIEVSDDEIVNAVSQLEIKSMHIVSKTISVAKRQLMTARERISERESRRSSISMSTGDFESSRTG